jgi:small redox-active disulfide protein 2
LPAPASLLYGIAIFFAGYTMKIQILGPGCPKCRLLEQHAREAVNELGIQAEFEKIEEVDDIMAFGVLMTPALAIDDEVKVVGRVLTKDQIKALLS